jgi:hypothetical protein
LSKFLTYDVPSDKTLKITACEKPAPLKLLAMGKPATLLARMLVLMVQNCLIDVQR